MGNVYQFLTRYEKFFRHRQINDLCSDHLILLCCLMYLRNVSPLFLPRLKTKPEKKNSLVTLSISREAKSKAKTHVNAVSKCFHLVNFF